MAGGSQAGPQRRLICKEHGWDLSISSSGVRFRRFSYLHEDVAATWQGPGSLASPASRRRLLWLVPLLLGGGSLTAGVLAAPAVSTAQVYSISVPVPDRPARAARPSAKPSVGRHAPSAPSHRAAVGGGDGAADSMDDAILAGANDLRAGTTEPTEERYTARAMRTGEMQSWQSEGVRYFLVAGDLQRADDKACRQFSLLARPDGGGDAVRQFERCRAGE